MATRPVEDIEAVLGRFQAWAGARNAVETGSGIREVPYEEALASGRYRWKSAGAAAPKKSGAKTSAATEPLKTSAAPAIPEPGKNPRATKAVRVRQRAKLRDNGNATCNAKSVSSGKPAPESKTGGGGNHCAAKSAASRKGSAVKPAFRDALAAAVRPAEMLIAQPAVLTRQAAISIRLAPSERALIQTRAAEAGITPSAYIRQCALEVEQLRAQVKAAVALIESGGGLPAAAVPVSAATSYFTTPASQPPVSAPGFFARIRRRFFPASAPALALRA